MNCHLSARCTWSLSLAWVVALFLSVAAFGQTVRNPKLAPADLETAKSATREGGGTEAELVYAARIDAVTKGAFDSLVVIYSKGAGAAKEFHALVVREGQKYPLAGDKSGRALPAGDRFFRIGLRHEAEKAPLLRLMGTIGASGQAEERQRNLDFQFNGKEFELVGQMIATPAK